MKKKHDRKCPCGSEKLFKDCCSIVSEGETPEEVKKEIKDIIIKTFDEIGQTRGELCLYVSNLVVDLLKLYNYKSYVVAGSARWNKFSSCFQWKPHDEIQEFHAWVITEFGETVDLACDTFETRRDAHTSLSIIMGMPSPKTCWDKNPQDRNYELRDLGAKTLKMSKNGYKQMKDIALDIYNKKSSINK